MLYTYTGMMFDVTEPDPSKIKIKDIAHANSLDCRYGGQCNRFYSVAEHCIHLSELDLDVTSRKILLLHDATEAYLRDIPADIKALPEMEGYRKLEENLYDVIMAKFGLPTKFSQELQALDRDIRANEIELLFDVIPQEWEARYKTYRRITGLSIQCWPPTVAEVIFLERFRELFGDI